MQLRPLAPLAVIGAGLLMMTLAAHPASATNAGAPASVNVANADSGLLVTWQGPSDTGGLTGYDLVVVNRTTGKQLLDRQTDARGTSATVSLSDLGGASDLSVTVSSSYGSQQYAGEVVRVTLPTGPAKPATPPAVRVQGRTLQVLLPAAKGDVSGRVLQLYRDGGAWSTISVKPGTRTITRTVATGHRYTAAYQDVNATGASPFSQQSAPVSAKAAVGPGPVTAIVLKPVKGGLRVGWDAALPQRAAIDEYRITMVKNDVLVGSAYAAGDLREVTVPGTVQDGVYAVTVTATDATGLSSASTVALSVTR